MSHPDTYLCNGHIGAKCLSCKRYEPIPKDGKYYMTPNITKDWGILPVCRDYIPRDNIKTDPGDKLCDGHLVIPFCKLCKRYDAKKKADGSRIEPRITYKNGSFLCQDFIPANGNESDSGVVKLSLEDKAREIIDGDREQTHGDPAKNLKVIAGLWSAYLGVEIKATDVCNLMGLLKIARLKNNPFHEDSLVDLKGYAILHEKILKGGPSDEKPKSDMLRPYDAFCPATTDSIDNKQN